MSKKKKKTKSEKGTSRFHNFSHIKSTNKEPEMVVDGEKIGERKPTTNIDPRVVFDLKKVSLFIGLIVGLVLIMAFLVYKTNYLNFLFSKFNIKY